MVCYITFKTNNFSDMFYIGCVVRGILSKKLYLVTCTINLIGVQKMRGTFVLSVLSGGAC